MRDIPTLAFITSILIGCSNSSSGSHAGGSGGWGGEGGTLATGGSSMTGGMDSGGSSAAGGKTGSVGSSGGTVGVSTGGSISSGGTPGSGGGSGTGGVAGVGGYMSASGGSVADAGSLDIPALDVASDLRPDGDAGGAVGGEVGTPEAENDGGGGFDPCPSTGDCKILPLGDSITWGEPTSNGGYRVELFTDAVNDQKNITFVGSLSDGPATVDNVPFPQSHEGHPGWTIAQVEAITTTAQTVSVSGQSNAGALRDLPHIVLLHIGTNDMADGPAGAPDRLGQLIDTIVADLPDSLLVVSSIIPYAQYESDVVTYNAAVPGVIRQRADQGKHVIYVDMFTNFPSNGITWDNVHPNDNIGYPWMGDRWYTTIKPYLH